MRRSKVALPEAHGAGRWPGPPAAGRRGALLAAGLAPLDRLAAARGQLFPLAPVLLSCGIALYFALPREPTALELALVAGLALLALPFWLRGAERWQPVAAAVMLLAGGFALAAWRANDVAAPVLGFRYYGPIEGRVVEIDRSASDRLRLTLDRVVLERMDPDRTPARVRISLTEPQPHLAPEPGMRVMMTGHLGPPGRPVEPGGFDFRRLAWFEGLGGIGYTRNPVMLAAPADGGWDLALHRLRLRLSGGVQAAIPGDAGAFAAAVTTGDRSAISARVNQEMRDSNLSHILSISGMHMALLAGFVFFVIRGGIALVPWLALRCPSKKVAAVVAILAATFYYALSGRDVATERSYVMVAMMLVAVLFDRRAISLRSVAMAGMVVLLLRPEALTHAGFQMSFAATVGLVVAFGWISRVRRPWPKWVDGLAMAVFSSFVAGMATLPLAAGIFNRIAEYGLAANLLASPAMAFLVMPGAVIAAVLAPLGLATPALWVAGIGSGWVLLVARVVAGMEGSVSAVATPHDAVLPLMALAGIWVALVPGRGRWLGLPVVLAAVGLWMASPRPALLIAESGGLSGLMTAKGRALSKPKGDGFAATAWLQADGDMAGAEQAGRRGGMLREKGAVRYTVAGREVVHLTGRGAAERVAAECRAGRIVITSVPAEGGDCLLLDAKRLARTGAVALWEDGRMETVAERQGDRLWTR